MLVGLLKDEEKLKVERSRALKAKERFAQSMSYMGTSVSGEEGATAGSLPRTSTSYHESLSSSSEHYAFGASSRLSSDLETARPQTVGEEELQLQLALAMSKEEAEQEDKQRKNDEIRLKMAINQSEGNASDSTSKKVPVNHHKQPTSAMDDLLSLNVTNNASSAPTDPWGVPFNNGNDAHKRDAFGGVLAHSAPLNNSAIKQQKDPWGSQTTPPMSYSAAVSGSAGVISSSVSDPWTNPVQSKVNNDPWQPSPHTTPDNSDPWSPTNNEGNRINNTSLSPCMFN
jgi:epsin